MSSWDKLLEDLTPWEKVGDVFFKREDKFAPLCPGGPNGSKMRQLIHLFSRRPAGATHAMTAASVLSPQHSMTAAVAHHYGLPSLHFVGGTKTETMTRHPNVRMAMGFGAQFEVIGVGYNPALQSYLEKRRRPATFVVPYGITTPEGCPEEDLRAFHDVGANQVRKLPQEVTTLIVPAGSCNSLTSVIYGLCKHGHGNLKELVSVGIGPDKVKWVQERLGQLGVKPPLPFRWNRKVSLHTSGFASYGDNMPANYQGIDFHGRYEGKIIRWLQKNEALPPREPGLGFWIVAAEADEKAVAACYPADAFGGEVRQEMVLEDADGLLTAPDVCEFCEDPPTCRQVNSCGIHGADLV